MSSPYKYKGVMVDDNCVFCSTSFTRHQRAMSLCDICKGDYKAERDMANVLLNRAVRNGDLARPSSCELCDLFAAATGYHKNDNWISSSNIVAHHHYGHDKPLEVLWICRDCNNALPGPTWHSGIRTKQQAIDYINQKRTFNP